MKKLVLSAFVLAGFMFTSCNNDDNKVEEGTIGASKYLPIKISSNDYTTNFTYNNKNQVTKITESDGYEYSFKYSGDQLIEFIELETYQGSLHKTTYTYTQSGSTVTVNYVYENNGNTNSGTDILQVDSKGYLINDGYFTYTYDTNGNNIKINSIYSDEAIMSYDSKNGIFKNLNLPQWVIKTTLSYDSNYINNLLTFNFTSQEDPEDNNSATMVYEYNNGSYPIKGISTAIDETGTEVETITIEYIKM